MKRVKRVAKLSALVLFVSIFSISVAFASDIVSAKYPVVIHQLVPKYQKYVYLDHRTKEKSGSMGYVNLSSLENEAVTFSAKATGSSNNYGAGTVVTSTNQNYVVNYTATYGVGQEMEARFRNHNYTSNRGLIIGYFYYDY